MWFALTLDALCSRAAFETDLQLRLMQEFIGVAAIFPGQVAAHQHQHWRRQIPLFHNRKATSIGSLPRVCTSIRCTFDLIIIDYFPRAFSPNGRDKKKTIIVKGSSATKKTIAIL